MEKKTRFCFECAYLKTYEGTVMAWCRKLQTMVYRGSVECKYWDDVREF
jgi:hypothetical protein